MRENRWKRGSCRASAQDLRILVPIHPLPWLLSSAVRALDTAVSEMEMSLRVVGGGVCKRAMGTGVGELVVNIE